jgi:hypothetical protein
VAITVKNCANCACWRANYGDETGHGECRALPPAPGRFGKEDLAVWPQTHARAWCVGGWQARLESTVRELPLVPAGGAEHV